MSCLAELGTLSMDNNCAAVAFPDFTRGQWNEQKGYKHAYNTTDEEKVDAIAAAATTAQKEQTAKLKLWSLYDAIAQAPNADAKAKAQKAFATAKVKALNVMQVAVKKAAMTK